MASLVWV